MRSPFAATLWEAVSWGTKEGRQPPFASLQNSLCLFWVSLRLSPNARDGVACFVFGYERREQGRALHPVLSLNHSVNRSISAGGAVRTASPFATHLGTLLQATRWASAHTAEKWKSGWILCLFAGNLGLPYITACSWTRPGQAELWCSGLFPQPPDSPVLQGGLICARVQLFHGRQRTGCRGSLLTQ